MAPRVGAARVDHAIALVDERVILVRDETTPDDLHGMIAAQASLMDSDLVPTRKKLIANTRNNTFAWLKANNYDFIPSQSNCFMIDVKRRHPGDRISVNRRELIDHRASTEMVPGRPKYS